MTSYSIPTLLGQPTLDQLRKAIVRLSSPEEPARVTAVHISPATYSKIVGEYDWGTPLPGPACSIVLGSSPLFAGVRIVVNRLVPDCRMALCNRAGNVIEILNCD